jgi:hypothetical protein
LRKRRGKVAKRSRWFWIVVAGFVGFLIGDRHAVTWQSTWQSTWQPSGVTASQNIALRFPEPQNDGPAVDAAAAVNAADGTPDTPTGSTNAAALSQAELALLNPQPMVPPPPARASAPAPGPEAAQLSAPVGAKAPLAAPRARAEPKPAADAAASHANRPGFLLNDAQIASIKRRLHLTPDQESMWPAVEAALRNVAYARAHEAHRQGGAANAAQLADADLESVEVQGLKSAAVPLLMSFSEQQKNEVRSLAHVMGLDKLATEF